MGGQKPSQDAKALVFMAMGCCCFPLGKYRCAPLQAMRLSPKCLLNRTKIHFQTYKVRITWATGCNASGVLARTLSAANPKDHSPTHTHIYLIYLGCFNNVLFYNCMELIIILNTSLGL